MTLDDITIAPAAETLPEDLAMLAAESLAASVRNVDTLIQRWVAGTERFEQAGEQLLVAWVDGAGSTAVGVGGITRCPDVPGALRVRRFYVSPAHRRRGVARLLAARLIAHGSEYTGVITCNARASDAAAPFWESMGFVVADVPGITHRLVCD